MPGVQLGYIILYVPHVPRTVAFLEEAFDIECAYLHESEVYAEMNTGDTRLGIAREDFVREQGLDFQAISRHRPAPAFELAFTTQEVEHGLARALEAGAVLVSPPALKPWGQTVAYVRAPDGFIIELCTPMQPRNQTQ